MSSLSFLCPGKVFVLGEYSCLIGDPALLVPCYPEFRLSASISSPEKTPNLEKIFHPDSPAGRLAHHLYPEVAKKIHIEWVDPYSTPIGVGSSSAQFVLTFQALTQFGSMSDDQEKHVRLSARDLLEMYWKVTDGTKNLRPSGLDVLLQSIGNPILATNHPVSYQLLKKDLLSTTSWTHFALLYSGEKTKTHEHLRELSSKGFPHDFEKNLARLKALTLEGKTAWENSDVKTLGASMNAYQAELEEMGLVPKSFSNAIEKIQGSDGVLGCKGSGAQGGDCLLILAEKDALSRILLIANKLGFKKTSARFQN